jgi:SOS response regulatory protein OraA/RecX
MSQVLIEDPGTARWRRIGEILVLRGLLDEKDVSAALAEQQRSGRRLGQILLDRGLVSSTAIDSALAEQASEPEPERGFGSGLRRAIGGGRGDEHSEQGSSRPPIGQVLRRHGYVSDDDIARALDEQSRSGKLIGEILVEEGTVPEPAVSRALEEQAGVEPEGGLFSGLRDALARSAEFGAAL